MKSPNSSILFPTTHSRLPRHLRTRPELSPSISKPSIAEAFDSPASSAHPKINLTLNPPPPPPALISPAFTPPSTPGTHTPSRLHSQHIPKSVPVNSTAVNGGCGQKKPKLLDKLPEVNCVVRARIPTTIRGSGAELYLHLYQNSEDNKEYLATVFGNEIRSQSLDTPREGETEMDRLITGAYTGKLYPGRTTSRLLEEKWKLENGKKEKEPPLVRIHSECYTGETVWSARCDRGEQLDEDARLMSMPESGGGIIIYLRQEGRGIGLGEKLKAYNLQDLGLRHGGSKSVTWTSRRRKELWFGDSDIGGFRQGKGWRDQEPGRRWVSKDEDRENGPYATNQ
ncbi:GTP cyclohydrolase II-domain-containing protein [Halenospora varia]|nr:GTP cyclohydrolase II-domain-containing protein [Halenospora varia]